MSTRRTLSSFRYCRLFSLLLLCVILLLPASCSRSKSGHGKIRLGYIQSDLHHLPVFVALEKGFFQEQGLEVEVAGAFRAGPELMSAFAARELDVGYVGLAPAITAQANGTARIRCLAQVNTEGSAIVGGKDPSCRTAAELKGRVVAIPGHATMQDFLLRKALKQAGLSDSEIKMIVLKPPEMIPALARKDIAACIAWEPYPSKAITQNAGSILLTSRQIWPHHPCCVVVADEGFCAARPDTVQKLRLVHQRACEFIKSDRQQAAAIGVRCTGMDMKTVQAALDNIEYDGVLDRSCVAEYVDFLQELRYIKPVIARDVLLSILPAT